MTEQAVTPVDWQLLPYQDLILNDHKTPRLAIPGGVGSGKSEFAVLWHHLKACKYRKGSSWCASHTADLVKRTLVKKYLDMLTRFGYVENVHYTYNRSDKILKYFFGHEVYFMSAVAWQRWMGDDLTHGTADERGYWPDDAFREFSNRLRGVKYTTDVKQLLSTGTPQGLTQYMEDYSGPEFIETGPVLEIDGKPFYMGRISKDGRKKVLHYPTILNPYNGDDYVQGRLSELGHDPNLVKAHLLGLFVPLFANACYEFSDKNIVEIDASPHNGEILLSWDFNVGQMSWTAFQKRQVQGLTQKWDAMYGVEECPDRVANTDEACRAFIEQFPPAIYRHIPIVVTGDRGGYDGNTASSVTDYDVIEAYLSKHYDRVYIEAPRSNPSIRTTLLATNRALRPNPADKRPILLYLSNRLVYTINSMHKTVFSDDGRGIAKPTGDTWTHRSDTVRYAVQYEMPFEEIVKAGSYAR